MSAGKLKLYRVYMISGCHVILRALTDVDAMYRAFGKSTASVDDRAVRAEEVQS